MELNKDAEIDTSQIDDQRGSGGGGLRGLPLPISVGGGGGIVGLIVLVIMYFAGSFGGSPLTDGGSGGPRVAEQCATSNENRLDLQECRNALYVNSIQNYWQTALSQSFGTPYQKAQTNFFTQAVNTGCGQADSGVGPFYCPEDDEVYIDLSFYDELASRFGAQGEFAQPYVLAHEYGHHVQDLLGTEAQMRRAQQRDPDNANRYSVMLELQADCYAGAWAKHATSTTDRSGKPIFTNVTQADIDQALDAAAAIGDDAIQKKMGGGVDESKFTHGSSAQRQEWFNRGYTTGDPKQCDTFGNAL